MASQNNPFADWDNVVSPGRNKLVFEDRNHEYGAFVIRTTYSRTMVRAIIASVIIFVVGVSIPTIISYLESLRPEEKKVSVQEVNLMDAPPIDKDEPPPPPVEPPPPVQETIKFVPPVVTNEPVPEEDIPPAQTELQESNAGVTTQEGTEGVIDLPVDAPKNEVIEDKEEAPLMIVEEMPSFPGGDEALVKFMQKNIRYPELEKENNIQGTVYVSFVITKEGKVSDVKVVRGVKGGRGLEEEAVRVIRNMPSWSIGKNNGRPVPVIFNYPVKFTLAQ